jgi:hypothetical protein
MERDHKKYPDRHLGQFLWLRDLAHMIKYLGESNGGQVTAEMKARAQEAVETWRKLVEIGNPRLVIEGLPFYTEAVQALTNGQGIAHSFNLISKKGEVPKQMGPQINAFYIDEADIRLIHDFLLTESLKPFRERYL